jgi:hypothetical protein
VGLDWLNPTPAHGQPPTVLSISESPFSNAGAQMSRLPHQLKRIVFGGAFLLAGAACSDDARNPAEPQGLASTRDAYVERIKALGFRVDMIEDHGDYFVVEGDIRLEKRDLEAGGTAGDLPPSLQWRTTNVSNAAYYHNLDISQLGSRPEWRDAAIQAVAEWNRLSGTSVRLFTDPCPNCYYRTVVSFYTEACQQNGCTLAVASWPSGGRPGPTIRINLAFNVGNGPGGQPTALAKLNTMVHEIGHTVAFRHTNWRTNDCQFPPCAPGTIGAILIPNTPETDAASVMQGSTANRDWAGFSFYDRRAARTLYKGFGPINQTGTLENGHPRLTWDAAEDAEYYNVYYTPPGPCETWYEQDMQMIHCYESSTRYLVGSTTGTSLVDASRTFGVQFSCGANEHHYTVSTVFPIVGETYAYAEKNTYAACYR